MIKPLILVILLLLSQTVAGQETLVVCGRKVRYEYLNTNKNTKFNYLVFDNIASRKERAIGIYLDKQFISDDNLKALFIYYAKKYPSPKDLVIYLETNKKGVFSSEECKRVGQSEKSNTDTVEDYPYVRFYKRKDNEFFRIFYENVAKTVVIKGRDSFAQ